MNVGRHEQVQPVESFAVTRRRELLQRIASLEISINENHQAVAALQVTRHRSLEQAAPSLMHVGAQRGELLKQWHATLAEFAALNLAEDR